MGEIPIENNIPMPNFGRRGRKYSFAEMAVGDSFFVPASAGVSLNAVRASASRAGKGRKATFRALGVEGGIRVWRTE